MKLFKFLCILNATAHRLYKYINLSIRCKRNIYTFLLIYTLHAILYKPVCWIQNLPRITNKQHCVRHSRFINKIFLGIPPARIISKSVIYLLWNVVRFDGQSFWWWWRQGHCQASTWFWCDKQARNNLSAISNRWNILLIDLDFLVGFLWGKRCNTVADPSVSLYTTAS